MLGWVQGINAKKGLVQSTLTGALPQVPATRAGVGATGGMSLAVTATFQINAPGGNVGAIKSAIEQDSAEVFAKQILSSVSAGAGKVY